MLAVYQYLMGKWRLLIIDLSQRSTPNGRSSSTLKMNVPQVNDANVLRILDNWKYEYQ